MKIRLKHTQKFYRYTGGKDEPTETLTLKGGSVHDAELIIANGLCRRGFKRPCPEHHFCPTEREHGDRDLCLQIEHEMELLRAHKDSQPANAMWPVNLRAERSKLEGEVVIDPLLDRRGHRPSEKWGYKLRVPSSWYQEVCPLCEAEVYRGSCSSCEWERGGESE